MASAPALVDVFCRNPFCDYRVKRGKAILVGRIQGRAELRCHKCKAVAIFEV